ncbi:acyl carrier protein [Solwaraspora sp. WMMD791]|uniref:acyl carrier protein n=1 Tax=Solwaraspora sp. WMMD791 TaxID=3016086 RepID=UPI00249AA41F|nr:acyl carrier protein [Solwaraspora sp. WMMD791]WFE28849.1 acyl carrier protein [Solwaraspora sp. WMMD791]
MSTSTLTAIAEIVSEISGVPAEDVQLGRKLSQDLGIDSLSMVEIAVALEERFGIEVSDDQIKDLVTVADAVVYVEARGGRIPADA